MSWIVSRKSMSPEVISISAIVATADRAGSLRAMLESLAGSSMQPSEVLIVDASPEKTGIEDIPGLQSKILSVDAISRGAAAQRNQGISGAREAIIWFIDDD